MKFCKNCGAQLNNDAKFCNNCGKNIKSSDVTINEEKENKKPSNKWILPSICIIAVIITLLIIGYLSKNSIMYSYYNKKGDLSNSTKSAVSYYTKALDYKYNDDTISKITDKIKEDENFEDILNNLRGTLDESDLNNIYVKIYVSKAKENFNNKNYETTWIYLNKAKECNYNIETFEYYNDLLKAKDKEDKEEVVKQDIHIYKNDTPVYTGNYYDYYSYFIIPDSNTRYLSKSELYGYDKYTLSLIRNEIFARHGYIFKKEEYKNYFNSMPWYSPDSSFKGTTSELNSIERYNVELIKSLE